MKSKLGSRRILRRENAFSSGEDINPMNYMNNLSDVMLVLAVGIMLALVIAWDVDITSEGASEMNNAEVELENQEVEIEDEDLEPYGTVYRDKEGNFYVLEDEK